MRIASRRPGSVWRFPVQPRHDLDAEMIVLGSAMLDSRVIDDCVIDAEDFYRPAHEQLWTLILTEHRAGNPINPVTLAQKLLGSPIKGLTDVYLHECLATPTTARQAPHYASMVRSMARLRRIADVGTALVQSSSEADWATVDEVLEANRARLDGVVQMEGTQARVRTFADALKLAVDRWDKPKPRAFRTGWPELDDMLNGGWRPGQLTVMGARPAVGKSLVAGCAAVAAAEYGCGFFSLEMSEEDMVDRLVSHATEVNLAAISNHRLKDDDWSRISDLVQKSADWPLYVEEASQFSMAQIRSKVRTWTRRGPVPLIVIDYLQLVTPASRSDQRERQVSRIAEDCKHLAKEFNTHVLALAQVNRGSTQREIKTPTMSDLRESGGIEAHADNIILLHREGTAEDSIIELIIAKNRHGKTGNLQLNWRPHVASVSGNHRNPYERYELYQTA
ncbi:replicative DNA helicase [Arthrobacter sp. AET 35A]|nr:DnaB-like helicase C-terminal domain-containing protein [Arthrobacter sp. AET 35A]